MLKHFTYIKKSGETSERVIYPLRLVDGDKILAIDLTEFSDAERNTAVDILDRIHRTYLDEIYTAADTSTYVYNQSPGTFVGRRTLAEHLGVCLKSISNWTKELEGLGWITVSRGQKKLRVNGNPVEIWSNIVELHDKPEKRK